MYLNHYFCPYKEKSLGLMLPCGALLPLGWLEGMGATGCFASVVSPECWWVRYKGSQQLKEGWDCSAAVCSAKRDALSWRICCLGVVISRFVCMCVFRYIYIKNINNIPTSTHGWWQMVLMVIIIMHHLLLSAFLPTYCSEMDIKQFQSVPSFIPTARREPFILVIFEAKY